MFGNWFKMALGGLLILFVFLLLSCRQRSAETKSPLPQIVEVNIPVQGMMCGSCEYHIETEVKRHNGVVEIKADHVKAFAHVKYDSSKISLDELVAAINETGYKASKPN